MLFLPVGYVLILNFDISSRETKILLVFKTLLFPNSQRKNEAFTFKKLKSYF